MVSRPSATSAAATESIFAMRNAIARGVVTGPRMLAAGPSLSITGGHGDANDLPVYVHVDREIESGVSFGPYGFRERVREHVKRHVDLIKITATGGVLSYGDAFDVPQFNLDEIQAVVDEAAKFGLHVAAHCHGDKGIRVAVDGGVRSIEHGTGIGDATLRAMRDRGTALVPTIWARSTRSCSPGIPTRSSRTASRKRTKPRSCAMRGCSARSRPGRRSSTAPMPACSRTARTPKISRCCTRWGCARST